MKGFAISEEAHVVQVTAPVDVTGGVTGQAFSMKRYQHASILVLIGVSAAPFTKIVVNQCTDASGSNPAAIRFIAVLSCGRDTEAQSPTETA